MASAKKPSLFAQRMENAKRLKSEAGNAVGISMLKNESIPTPNFDGSSLGDRSNIVQGPDAEVIHHENLRKLSEMTSVEIEEEQNKLLTNLNPAIIEFLKSKQVCKKALQTNKQLPDRNPINSHLVSQSDSDKMDYSEGEVPTLEQTPAAQLVNKFPHMDVVEPEKLQWMQDLPPPKPLVPGCPYNARFNFEGELLPFASEELLDGLHHHGEEPERPGYTLSELMQLSRSSVLQQRITALTTLANIFHKASDYDYCLEKPLLSQLLDSELYLLLRFSLDDPVRSVVTAAVAAISSLLVNVKDEGCLDRLLGLSSGLRQPLFYVHLDVKPNELAELKDTELLKVDVIRGALRTHLLPRFRYILDRLEPEPAEVGHMMRCLIRVARHSCEAATSVCNAPGLLAAVRAILAKPPPQACSDALKLFRVLASHSRDLAEQLIVKFTLLEPIQRFIAGDQDETSMSLTLESFYTWQVFLNYHLANGVSEFSSVVQRLLLTHSGHVSLDSSGGDLEHAAALISWVTSVLWVDSVSAQCYVPALQQCALKWLSQAMRVSHIKWAGFKMLRSILRAIASLIAVAAVDLQDSTSKEIYHKIELFLDSDNFGHLSEKLRQHSWLLQGQRCFSEVESLPCLGSVPPSLFDTSPLPLITGLAEYVYAIKSPQLSEKFVISEGIQRYMEKVVTSGVGMRTSHWFARQEITLIHTLLQIHLSVKNVKTTLVHQVALFLSTSIHADDRYILSTLFEEVIFNKHFFSFDITDVVTQLENLKLNVESKTEHTPKLLSEALHSLETICDCYLQELGLKGLRAVNPPPSLTASHCGTDPALPADWHCLPIVHLNNIDEHREGEVGLTVACLQWSLVLECLRPRFTANISVAARFCRLACVLLAGNELFRDVRDWLSEVLRTLLVHNRQMNFEEPIPGLQSFYDFYRQILEQFVGVSYGDAVFGQFVLVPLQQRHSARLRKLVWCELGAVLRFLSTPVNQVGVPLENFLEPCETDPDLLFIYLKALGQGRIKSTFCPVLYRVAVHHVVTFVTCHADLTPAKKLKQMIESLGNQELKNILLHYTAPY